MLGLREWRGPDLEVGIEVAVFAQVHLQRSTEGHHPSARQCQQLRILHRDNNTMVEEVNTSNTAILKRQPILSVFDE